MTDQKAPEAQWINNKGEGVQFGGGEPKPDDRHKFQTIDAIAELGWQTHIAWEDIIREDQKPYWIDLSSDQRAAIVESVQWLIEHPTSSIAAQHDAWRARMAGEGWLFGEHKDDVHHPNMVPFEDLPFSQQMKARLWRHIIFAVLG